MPSTRPIPIVGGGDGGYDFFSEDRIDAQAFNDVLWKGLMGARPYPRHGRKKD